MPTRPSEADCTPVSYSLENDEQRLRFLKSVDQPFAQFILDVEWRSEPEEPTKTKTFIDFELVKGGYEVALPACPAPWSTPRATPSSAFPRAPT